MIVMGMDISRQSTGVAIGDGTGPRIDPRGPDAEEIADLLGTIPYEITCMVSKRVPRLFVDAAAPCGHAARPASRRPMR